jgi:hypothetical protein
VLEAVDGEVAVVEVDHRDARPHEARDGEHRDARAEGEGGVGVAEVVEVAQWVDTGRFLDRFPVPPVEVSEVEIAAEGVGEQQRALLPRRQLVERLERDRLQRNRASAQPRLGLRTLARRLVQGDEGA